MRIFICLLIVIVPFWGAAQNSDCTTALSVCNDVYEVVNAPAGTGNVFELAPGSCQTSGEFNSAWYVFTAQDSGPFSFTLIPNSLNDDYDWSLFNITDNGCNGINSGLSTEVSCNSYGEVAGIQGATGISSASGGTGNSNGPGNLLGPIFNADLPMIAGEVYALVVMNFSATLNGYTLDFSESNASIFDNQPPVIVSLTSNCNQSQFSVTLSEGCLTGNMTAANMTLTHDGTVYPIATMTGVSGLMTDQFGMNVNGMGSLSGPVTLTFNNALTDVCGNPIELEYVFDLPGAITVEITTIPSCAGEDGGLEVIAAGLGGECYTFSVNGNGVASSGCDMMELDGLTPGNYSITVNGVTTPCPVTFTASIEDIPVTVDAGEDMVLCDLSSPLGASFAGGAFEWLAISNVTFSDTDNPASIVSTLIPGEYTMQASVTSGTCQVIDGVLVTFNFPPELTLNVTHESCFAACDGSIELSNAQGSISASVGGAFISGEQIEFSNLCDSTYALVVVFSPECTADYEVEVESPLQVVAEFEADPWVTTVNQTDILLTNNSLNADSVLWITFHDLSIVNTSDEWVLSLPDLPGIYAIQLIAFGANGCMDSFLANVIVEDDFQVYIPSAITADFDGINDVFLPRFSYVPEQYELLIFNRWGDVIFESTDPFQAWMANSNDGEHFVRDGVYLWLLTVKGKEIDERILSGHLTVLR